MSFSTATGIALIDSRNKSGILTLPSVTDIPGRILYVKDTMGVFNTSSLILSTQLNQYFNNGSNRQVLEENDGYVMLASDGVNTWNQIGGTAVRESFIQNARISTLYVKNSISTIAVDTFNLTARSTIDIDTRYFVGPNSKYYRGNDLFTPLTMTMSLYDLPISTMTNMDTWRVNKISTIYTNSEFNLKLDFGAYPYEKKYYSSLTQTNLSLQSRSLNIKLWGIGGNSGYLGTNAVPQLFLRGGAGAFMNVRGFYPSYVFGEYYDPISYSLNVPQADTTYLDAKPYVVSSFIQESVSSNCSGRGAIYGPTFQANYQGSNYDILSPASGGGGVWQSNLDNGSVTFINGADAGSNTISRINNTVITQAVWNPSLDLAALGYGIGGGGGQIGQCNLVGPGGAGISLSNLQAYCYPWNTPDYTNGSLEVMSAADPISQSDPDYIAAGGYYGMGGSGNLVTGSGLGSNGLAVIEQPYDALTSNITLVGYGSCFALQTAPVTFRLTGPDGLFLSINNDILINDWTVSNEMHSISSVYVINKENQYTFKIMAFNATSSNNNLQFEYFVENNITYGSKVIMSISSGTFMNNASVFFTSSILTNSLTTTNFTTNTITGQSLKIVSSNTTTGTPFYVETAATFADTLVVQKYVSVGNTLYASSINVSSIILQNMFVGSEYQNLQVYDSTLTLGSLEIMTELNASRLFVGSTIIGLGTFGYISSQVLGSVNFTSTVTGLGTVGYLSSLNTIGSWNFVSSISLRSSIQGLGSLGYISSSRSLDSILQSTTTGLGSSRYISSASLTSTIIGLGSAGYISSANIGGTTLASTVVGLGSSRYLSSVNNFGSLGYISTASLTSSLNGIGTLGYLSSVGIQSTINSGVTNINIIDSSTITLNTHYGEVARFTSSGQIGFGTSTLFTSFDVEGSVYFKSTFYVSTGAIVINRPPNSVPNADLEVNGSALLGSLFVSGQGTFGTSVTAQSFATPSDKKLKGDIQTISSPMDIIVKSRGVEFTWNTNKLHDYGYIAQEVESYLPEAILRTDSTLYVKYDVFVPIITEALKSLQQQIDELRLEIRK